MRENNAMVHFEGRLLGGRASPRRFARFSLIPFLKIDDWSLQKLEVRQNDAMVHLEGKLLGGRANPRRSARCSLIPHLKIDNWSLPNLEVRENDAFSAFSVDLGLFETMRLCNVYLLISDWRIQESCFEVVLPYE